MKQMKVTETLVVGDKFSMAYLACREKFGRRKFVFKNFDQIKDVIKKGSAVHRSAVLPLWNSNAGIIKRTEPEKLIFDMGSDISDLWCAKIIFAFATKPNFKTSPTKIGSAEVAKDQCSKFLEEEKLVGNFSPFPTTTDAAAALRKGKIEGVLCSNELAKSEGLMILRKDCANPFNVTTFSEFVSRGQAEGNVSLVAVEMPRLDMGGTMQAHEEVMEKVFGDIENFSDMPKIVFAMRTREDKYGLVLEFPNFREGSPLPPSDEQADVRVVDIGRLLNDFSSRACDYMIKTFHDSKWPDFAYYGRLEGFFCACPALNIFVQGYDLAVVKELAVLSLERHVDLFAHDIKHPDPDAQGLLNRLFNQVKKGRRIQDFVKFVPLANPPVRFS